MVPHLGLRVCLCMCLCDFVCTCVSSLVSSSNRAPRTHTCTHPRSYCLSECLFIASAGPNAHPSPTHTHTLTQAYAQNHSSSTPSVPSPHSSHFKWPPKIAQEAIRKNTARGGGGGSCRVLQSKAIGGYQASLSLLFCLFPLSSSLCLALLPLFVPMNQCCSVHAH